MASGAIWKELYTIEKQYAEWYREFVSQKYTTRPTLLKLEERGKFICSINLGRFSYLSEKAKEALLKIKGITLVPNDRFLLINIEKQYSRPKVAKELGIGRVSYARFRRYLEAFCELPLSKKRTPVTVDLPKVPKAWRKDALCQMSNGLFIWMPYVNDEEWAEEAENDFWRTPEEERRWEFSYRIIFSSPLHQLLVYYIKATRPERRVLPLNGLSIYLAHETIFDFLQNPPYHMIKPYLDNVIPGIYPSELFTDEEVRNKVEEAVETILTDHTKAPLSALVVKGCLEVIKRWLPKKEVLRKKVEDQRKKAAEAARSVKSCPPLPHFAKDFKLLPHQAAVLGSLKEQDNAILGVEMGGGKTLLAVYDALVKIAEGKVRRPCIIMPNNLLYQFKNEIAKFTAGSVNAIIVNTNTTQKLGLDKLKNMIINAPKNTIILCSYEWLSHGATAMHAGSYVVDVYDRAAWLIGECGCDMITLDEAHFIKNATSNRTKAALLVSNAKVKRVMSGTIVPNKLGDLVVPISLVKPHIFRGLEQFEREYLVKQGKRTAGYRPNAPDEIKAKLAENNALMLSRSAWIYLLPERKIRLHKVELNEVLRADYEQILENTMHEIAKLAEKNPEIREALATGRIEQYPYILQKLTALDKFLGHPASTGAVSKRLSPEPVSPKIAKINEILKEHFAKSDKKVIIMTKFKTVAKHILENIIMKDQATYFDGAHAQNLVKFKNNPNIKILVGVDKALKHGWNITEATRLIRVDLNYAWGDEDQLFGRIFRIGQTEAVEVDIILTDNTLEVTKFINLVKKNLVNSYVATDVSRYIRLTEDDLQLEPFNVQNIREKSAFAYTDRYKDLLNTLLTVEKKVGEEHYAPMYGKEMIDPVRAKPISLKKIPVPYIKNVDTSLDWYIGHKKPKFDFTAVEGYAEVPPSEPHFTPSINIEEPGAAAPTKEPKTPVVIKEEKKKQPKAFVLGFDSIGMLWLKPVEKDRELLEDAVILPKAMRRVGKGWAKLHAFLAFINTEVFPIMGWKYFNKRLLRLGNIVKGSKESEKKIIYIFLREDLGKNYWEILIPGVHQKLAAKGFRLVPNVAIIPVLKVTDAPEELQDKASYISNLFRKVRTKKEFRKYIIRRAKQKRLGT